MASAWDFEGLVARYYEPLYQFAFSLTRAEADACDLTQQTFYVWATKGHQLREPEKVKTWLFTTLHRMFLETCRRRTRFPHQELESSDLELPVIQPGEISRLDTAQVVAALGRVDEPFQAPVALFYLQDHSYKEIAEILDLPLGTVKSRISRGIGQLQKMLAKDLPHPDARKQP
jgi:RNA polymerase sigma factor (sigma-70 family)